MESKLKTSNSIGKYVCCPQTNHEKIAFCASSMSLINVVCTKLDNKNGKCRLALSTHLETTNVFLSIIKIEVHHHGQLSFLTYETLISCASSFTYSKTLLSSADFFLLLSKTIELFYFEKEEAKINHSFVYYFKLEHKRKPSLA